MKTQFTRRIRRLSPVQTLLLGAVVFVVAVFLVLRIFFPDALVYLAAPFWGVGSFFTQHVDVPESTATLRADIARLEAENRTLANDKATLQARLHDLGTMPDESGIVAGVLARPPLSPYDALVVGAGSADGVYQGMLAYADGVPAGTVESVGTRSARVALYSAPGRASEGWAGEARIPVTLRGLGAGAFEADVPREAALIEGDSVYLPGPGALPMGVIVKIDTHASSPRSTLSIRPVVNPFSLTWVRIIAAPAP